MAGTTFQQSLGGVTTGIVAGTTQTSAGATALTTKTNIVATVGTTNDGVRLPLAPQNDEIMVYIAGANTAKIYPPTGGTINGGGTDAAVTLATTKAAKFVCTSADGLTWYEIAGA